VEESEALVRWMERAAVHQTRALASLRRARDPAAGPRSIAQRRAMLLRGLEHIVEARRLLQRAQSATPPGELLGLLNQHLARLEVAASTAERLLQELDAAEDG
jgi:hypothetical protein